MADYRFILAVTIAYFLGNISPSTIQARMRGIDIKKEGSGNAGTTNTLRVLGARAALITLVVDIGKGVLAVALGYWIATPAAAMWCALAAFLGHVFPVLLKFKGGKGVAVAFGVLLGLNWKLALAELGIVLLAVILTRRVSFGSIFAAVAFPFLCWYMEPDFIYIGCVMAALVLIMHRSNIIRLIHGEEDKVNISWFKKKGGEE